MSIAPFPRTRVGQTACVGVGGDVETKQPVLEGKADRAATHGCSRPQALLGGRGTVRPLEIAQLVKFRGAIQRTPEPACGQSDCPNDSRSSSGRATAVTIQVQGRLQQQTDVATVCTRRTPV